MKNWLEKNGNRSYSKRLLLFDIDGTLIFVNGAGRYVLANAMHKIYGTAGQIETYPFSGKTDLYIIRDLLIDAGVSGKGIEEGLPALLVEMEELGRKEFPTSGLRPCPGTVQLLEILSGRDDIMLGLLTGNVYATAFLKLKAAGIDPSQFSVGAFGSDATDRRELPPIAWQRAAQKTKSGFSGTNTIIIGDTPADIEAARKNKCLSVAVATGTVPAEKLATYEPDYLLDELSDTNVVLNILSK